MNGVRGQCVTVVVLGTAEEGRLVFVDRDTGFDMLVGTGVGANISQSSSVTGTSVSLAGSMATAPVSGTTEQAGRAWLEEKLLESSTWRQDEYLS